MPKFIFRTIDQGRDCLKTLNDLFQRNRVAVGVSIQELTYRFWGSSTLDSCTKIERVCI